MTPSEKQIMIEDPNVPLDLFALSVEEGIKALLARGYTPENAADVVHSNEVLRGMHNDYVDDTDPALI